MRFPSIPILLIFSMSALAGDLPPALQAKFVRIICGSSNAGMKIASKDSAINEELKKLGVALDPGSKVAWASSEGETTSQKHAGKMVITPNLQWLAKGGAIALIEEDGKPQIYLHMGNIAASTVTLSDTILKIGKRL